MPPMVNKNDKIPILPMNIKIIRIHFPNPDKSGVIPIDAPHVPNADETSKMIAIKLTSFSEIDNINTDDAHNMTASIRTTNDFITSS